MLIKTKEGTKDVPVTQVTSENYIVPPGEEGQYHCLIEIMQYDPKSGRRMSRPRVQKFGAKVFRSIVEKGLAGQGYSITVLHDPTGWLKEKEEERQRMKEMAALSPSVRLQREKESIKAEVLAELKASGVIPSGDNGKKSK